MVHVDARYEIFYYSRTRRLFICFVDSLDGSRVATAGDPSWGVMEVIISALGDIRWLRV